MKTSFITKSVQYLVWVGISLFFVGLSAGLVSGTWGAVPMVLMILGLAIIAFWILLQVTAQGFWMKRSTQVGTNALVATGAMLIILGLFNVLVARYPQQLDLTENQILSLAPQSRAVLKELQKPVKAYIFATNKDPQVDGLLSNYARISPDTFSYEFVDPVQEPALVQAFNLKDQGDIYLDTGSRKPFVQNIFREPLSESKITNALARLKSDRVDAVYFLQGHGEHSPEQISQALELLGDRNYDVAPLNLAEQLNSGQGIPEDASVVIVSGPQRSLFPKEVQALKSFVDGGGGLLLMIDPNTEPKLDSLLGNWGVSLDDRLIIDGSDALGINATGGVVGLGPTSPLVTRYGDHPITASFGNGISFYPLSRAVNIQERSGIAATPLLLTNDKSWAEKDIEAQVQFNEERDQLGPLILGAALSKPAIATPVPEPAKTESAQSDADGSETGESESTESETTESENAESEAAESEDAEAADSETDETEEAASEDADTEAESEAAESEDAASEDVASNSSEPESAEPVTDQEARLVVIGNASFVTNGPVQQQLNPDVFANAVSWLSQREGEVLSISPREMTNRRLVLSPLKGNSVAFFAVLLLPLIGFGSAGFLWWQRR